MAFDGGTGTVADPYQISTALQLQEMEDYLSSSFILTEDIDVSDIDDINGGKGLEPVGSNGTDFTGTFDGDGHTISNLALDWDGKTYVGLFGKLSGGNNQISNGDFGDGASWTANTGWTVGATAAYNNAGSFTLEQSSAQMAVPLNIGATYTLIYTLTRTAGTITPSCAGVPLTARSTSGTFTETFVAVSTAALVFTPSEGSNLAVDNVELYQTRFVKDVTITGCTVTVNEAYNGVLCGQSLLGSYGYISGVTCSGVMVAASDSSIGSFVGGIAGYATGGTYSDCHSTLTLTGPSVSNVGGFFGSTHVSLTAPVATSCTSSLVMVSTARSTGSIRIGGFSGEGLVVGTDCSATCSIVSNGYTSTQGSYVGGFIGSTESGRNSLLRCYATGGIVVNETSQARVGGFAGESSGASKCWADVDIELGHITGEGSETKVGGFVGGAYLEYDDCYSRGDVCKSNSIGTTTRISIGGFAGNSSALNAGEKSLVRCYSTGRVTTHVGTYADCGTGGFLGARGVGIIEDCYWDTETSRWDTGVGEGESQVGITGLPTAQMKVAANYAAGWDFATVWEITEFNQPETLGSNLTVWLSKTGDYENFSEGIKDDDSFSLTLPTQNAICWSGSLEALLVGTSDDEFRIDSNKLGTSITPTNFKSQKQSEYGGSRIQPIKANASLMFVDAAGRKLREMTFTGEKYDSPDVTVLAEHITRAGIIGFARQKNPDSIIWVWLGDGTLLSMTYEREQDVVSWAVHPIGGDGFVQSVAVIPGEGEDVVYLSVARTINGAEVVYLEKMASRYVTAKEDSFFVDSGIVFTAETATSTITGLTHLEGETVSVLGDGVVFDDAVVASGQITATLNGTATAVNKAIVGLPYTSKVQPQRIVLGDSMGSETRVSELVVSFFDTGAASYGSEDATQYEIDFTDARWTNTSEVTGLFTGEVVEQMPGGFDTLNPIVVTTNKPLPMTLRCMVPRMTKTGR